MHNSENHKSPIKNDALQSKNLIGLPSLRKTLERDFFPEASIDVLRHDGKKADLVIHLNCNFGLTESLFHLNNGNWGNFQSCIAGDKKIAPFQASLITLENDNKVHINITELSIHLRDTSLIINKLPDHMIQDNLEEILDTVSGNFVHFTKGLTQMPYEIFIPIYEEKSGFNTIGHPTDKTKYDYLSFWGLYFEGEDDTLVYDVKNKLIIEESDFFLLNQWD